MTYLDTATAYIRYANRSCPLWSLSKLTLELG